MMRTLTQRTELEVAIWAGDVDIRVHRRRVKMIRYIGTERHISRIDSAGWGAHTIWEPRRIPTIVREKFSGLTHGRHEVEYDPKTRTAKIVPFHERWRI